MHCLLRDSICAEYTVHACTYTYLTLRGRAKDRSAGLRTEESPPGGGEDGLGNNGPGLKIVLLHS